MQGHKRYTREEGKRFISSLIEQNRTSTTSNMIYHSDSPTGSIDSDNTEEHIRGMERGGSSSNIPLGGGSSDSFTNTSETVKNLHAERKFSTEGDNIQQITPFKEPPFLLDSLEKMQCDSELKHTREDADEQLIMVLNTGVGNTERALNENPSRITSEFMEELGKAITYFKKRGSNVHIHRGRREGANVEGNNIRVKIGNEMHISQANQSTTLATAPGISGEMSKKGNRGAGNKSQISQMSHWSSQLTTTAHSGSSAHSVHSAHSPQGDEYLSRREIEGLAYDFHRMKEQTQHTTLKYQELKENNKRLMGDFAILRTQYQDIKTSKGELEEYSRQLEHQLTDVELRLSHTTELYTREKIDKENNAIAFKRILEQVTGKRGQNVRAQHSHTNTAFISPTMRSMSPKYYGGGGCSPCFNKSIEDFTMRQIQRLEDELAIRDQELLVVKNQIREEKAREICSPHPPSTAGSRNFLVGGGGGMTPLIGGSGPLPGGNAPQHPRHSPLHYYQPPSNFSAQLNDPIIHTIPNEDLPNTQTHAKHASLLSNSVNIQNMNIPPQTYIHNHNNSSEDVGESMSEVTEEYTEGGVHRGVGVRMMNPHAHKNMMGGSSRVKGKGVFMGGGNGRKGSLGAIPQGGAYLPRPFTMSIGLHNLDPQRYPNSNINTTNTNANINTNIQIHPQNISTLYICIYIILYRETSF